MTFKGLVLQLTTLCAGIFIYTYMTDQLIVDAFGYSYWCVFGGTFIWFKMRKESK